MKTFYLKNSYSSISDIMSGQESKDIIFELQRGDIEKYQIVSATGKTYAYDDAFSTIVKASEPVSNPYFKPVEQPTSYEQFVSGLEPPIMTLTPVYPSPPAEFEIVNYNTPIPRNDNIIMPHNEELNELRNENGKLTDTISMLELERVGLLEKNAQLQKEFDDYVQKIAEELQEHGRTVANYISQLECTDRAAKMLADKGYIVKLVMQKKEVCNETL